MTEQAIQRLVAALEESPSLEDWRFEVEVSNLEPRERDGVPVIQGIPMDRTAVRVRSGMGTAFWEALADVYFANTDRSTA